MPVHGISGVATDPFISFVKSREGGAGPGFTAVGFP